MLKAWNYMFGVLSMIDVTEIYPLTDFQRNAKEHIDRLARSGRPEVLTVNGKAAVVVQDAASYQKLLLEIDRLEAIEGIRRGIEAVKAGKTRPIEEAMEEIRLKYEGESQRK